MAYGFDGGFGIVALIWIVLVVAFWVLIIVALVLGVRWLMRQERSHREAGPPPSAGATPTPAAGPRTDDPHEILRQRYARGEIDEDEFERRRRTLGGS